MENGNWKIDFIFRMAQADVINNKFRMFVGKDTNGGKVLILTTRY